MKNILQKSGKYFALAFSVLVVGLLIYGHVFDKTATRSSFRWEKAPVLYVCDTAPTWAKPGSASLTKALQFWIDQGHVFASVETGPCSELCKIPDGAGKEIEIACNIGKVTLDKMDAWGSVDEAGICHAPVGVPVLGAELWTTIRVPEDLVGALPLDSEALVLAHEVGHCLVGLEHSEGPSLGGGCSMGAKKGHVMSAKLKDVDWGTEGL